MHLGCSFAVAYTFKIHVQLMVSITDLRNDGILQNIRGCEISVEASTCQKK